MTPTAPTRAPAVGVVLTFGIVGIEVSLALGYFALATVLPQVAHSFHAESAFSVAAAAAMITSVLGYVLASPWADRAGPRPALAAGFACLLLGAVGCATAPSMDVFIGARLLVGLGTGFLGVATYSLVSHLVHPDRRAWIFGLINGAWLLPSLIGPLVAGAAAETFGWRPVFWGVAALMLVSYLALSLGIRGRVITVEPGPVARTPWVSGALASLALFALHVGGERVDRTGLAVSGIGLVATVVTLWRLLPAGTFTGAAGAPRLIALRGVLGATMGAAETYVPFYLQTHRGMSMTLSGLVIAGSAIGWGAGAMTQSRLVRGLGPARFLQVCSLVGPSVPLVILAVIVADGPVWVIASALAVLGFGLGSAFPQISTLAFELSPQREHGTVGGALQLGESAASGAVLALTGLVLGFGGGGALPWVYAVPVVLGTLGVLLTRLATDGAESVPAP